MFTCHYAFTCNKKHSHCIQLTCTERVCTYMYILYNPWCSVPEIWIGAKGPSLTLYMWKAILCGACIELSNWWLPQNQGACHGITVEPTLQTLSGEWMALSSAITTNDARVDIQATGFWGDRKQRAFFDVKVFNPSAKSYRDIPVLKCYKRCGQQKKRAYEERIHEVEHGSFLHSTHFLNTKWYELRRQQPCTGVLPPFCQARDQNRIPGRSTGSDTGLDLLFSDQWSCAWEGPAPPICTSSGIAQRIVLLQWTVQSARGGSKQLLLFNYTYSPNYYCDCTM